MPLVRLGLFCGRRDEFGVGPARSALENAVEFFEVSQSPRAGGRGALALARLDASATDIEASLREAVMNDVTHVLFLSPNTILPFYSLQSLLDMRARAVTGISWTYRAARAGAEPVLFPRIGYFDPEGRPFPYFGWSAPDVFEVDWCGIDCLLVERDAIEEIIPPLRGLREFPQHLRISLALRSSGIPIVVDSFIQCPNVMRGLTPAGRATRKLVPGPRAWLEFSRDYADRRVPIGPVYDPAYRGRQWYREWLTRCLHDEDGSAPAVKRDRPRDPPFAR